MKKIMIIVGLFLVVRRAFADNETVHVENMTVTEYQSESVLLKCIDTSSSSSQNYRWSKSDETVAYLYNGHRRVAEKFKRHIKIDENGNLVLRVIPREYAGTYECEFQDFAKQSVSRKQVHVTVIYLDAPEIELSINVREGDNLNISCHGGNAFPDSSLKIFKDQQPIRFLTVDTLHYTISNATYLNTGVYYCEACNDAGCKNSTKIRLNVHYCVVTNFTLEKGQLSCTATGHPEPNTTIIFDGNVVENGKNITTYLQEGDCNVTAECVAENGYSSDTKFLVIQACNGTNDQSANNSDNVNVVVVVSITILLLICFVVFGVILWLRRQHSKDGQKKTEDEKDPMMQMSMSGDADSNSSSDGCTAVDNIELKA